MGKLYGEIDAPLRAFVEAQRMFFVATAPLDAAGHVNVSPKGLDTLRILEDALLTWNGCSVVVSHDRFFLDRIATHILSFEGDGKVRWFNGNYQAYIAKRKEEVGEDGLVPRRGKWRPLE